MDTYRNRALSLLGACILSILSLPSLLNAREVRARGESVPPDTLNPALDPLFASDEILELTLTSDDLKSVLKDRNQDSVYREGKIGYRDARGDSVWLDVGIRTRGFFRLMYINCDVPPLRLNFKKSQTTQTLFAGQDKLKLVTHCDDGQSNEQRLLQEYLIYRAYQLLTPFSFRTRLVRISYIDTRDRRKPMTHYAFFIEDDDRMAVRNRATIIENLNIHPEATDRRQSTLLAVFQFMVGNTDWTISTRHNIRVIYTADAPTTMFIAVPYDFDFAGLINAPYANPDPKLNLRSVRDRRYLGFCREDEEYTSLFDVFKEQREAIITLFQTFPLLDPKYARTSVEYLEDFYEMIENPRRALRAFRGGCQ